jgi:FkbM family methyltransferase
LLKNWRAALASELGRDSLRRLEMRNGVVINSPETLELDFLFHEIWVRRTYTPPGYEIQPGDVVIDIGANIGVFATYAATAAPGVMVYSYEPFPGNVIWLRKNVQESHLTNVQVYSQAVAGAAGERVLHVNPSSWIEHSLLREEGRDGDGITVECISLDQVLEMETGGRCDFLKLDCEGSEYEILMNCRPETLRRIRRIVGEYHEGPEIDCTGQRLREFLESRSFRIDYFAPLDTDSGIFCATSVAV